jgi:hypothetical protein
LENNKTVDLNGEWKTVSVPAEDAPLPAKLSISKPKLTTDHFVDAPEGECGFLRFGYHVIGDKESVDI